MTGAIALTVVLVIAVIGVSLALQSQHTLQAPGARPDGASRPPRVPRPPASRKDRRRSQPPAGDPPPAMPTDPGIKGPDLLDSGVAADAKVISVVDERTIGPLTRSKLTLQISPGPGKTVEITTRVAFPTPAARARVKVGATVKVRYDKDDPTRVVVDLPAD